MNSIGKRIASGLIAFSMVAAGLAAEVPSFSNLIASAAVTDITVNMDDPLIWVGGETLTAYVPGNPNNITWSSENTSQLTVTKDSNQTSIEECSATIKAVGKGDGTCTITAKDSSTGKSYSLEIDVKKATTTFKVMVDGVDVTDKDTIYIDKDETLPINVTVNGDDGYFLALGDANILKCTYTEIKDENGKGTGEYQYNLKGGKKGTTTLTCSTKSGAISKTYTVKTLQPSKEENGTTSGSYIVEKGKSGYSSGMNIVAGHSLTLQAKLTPSSSDDVVTWSSSATAIATVSGNDDNTCTLNALKGGTCIVTAAVHKNSDKQEVRYTMSYIVNVSKNVPATALSFCDENGKDISEMTIVKDENNPIQLNLTKTPAETTDVITYETSDSSIAEVDAESGMLTPKKSGEVTITARAENATVIDTLKVTVKTPATSLSISDANKVLPVGQTYQLTSTASPTSADDAVDWVTSDSSIATVDAQGVVTAKKSGTVTITAKAKYSLSPVTVACKVTVVPAVPTTKLTLTDDCYIALKETKVITATCATASGEKTNDVITWKITDAEGNTLAPKNNYMTYVLNDYSVNITGAKSGIVKVTATATSGKTDTTTVKIGKDIKKCTVDNIANQPVTGKEIKPKVTVKDENGNVLSSSNYSVSYSNNINKGTAQVTITGKGNYCPESITKTFKIVANPVDMSKLTVSLEKTSYDYTGKAIKPAVTVKSSGKVVANSNYTVTYSNNTYPGKATVTIKAKGEDYTGSVTKTFTIKGKMSKATISKVSAQYYTGKAITPSVTVKLGTKTLTKNTDYTVSYKNNTKVGTATITVTGKGNYSGAKSTTFTIKKKTSIAKATVSGIKSKVVYTGKAITPTVKVKLGSTTLKKNTDYTVAYKNNKNTGKATVTITGKGKYTGTITKSFYIIPKATTISKATSPKKSQIKVTWKKNAQATGYQVVYSTNSKFKNSKGVFVTKNSTLSKTITKLSAGKKYYVKVRAYKLVGKTKVYGAYSKTLKVTVKKK